MNELNDLEQQIKVLNLSVLMLSNARFEAKLLLEECRKDIKSQDLLQRVNKFIENN
jgi:hypothetical protein